MFTVVCLQPEVRRLMRLEILLAELMNVTHPLPLPLFADMFAAWLNNASRVAWASLTTEVVAVAGGDFVGGVTTGGAFVRGSFVAVGDLFVSIMEQTILDSVSFLSRL